jgi:hypothetical protein
VIGENVRNSKIALSFNKMETQLGRTQKDIIVIAEIVNVNLFPRSNRNK